MSDYYETQYQLNFKHTRPRGINHQSCGVMKSLVDSDASYFLRSSVLGGGLGGVAPLKAIVTLVTVSMSRVSDGVDIFGT